MKNFVIFIILFLGHSSLFAQGIELNCKSHYAPCNDCNEELTIFPKKEFSTDPGSLDIEANNSEILGSDMYYFSGDVILKSDSYILSSDSVKVLTTDESTIANGNVQFQDESFLIAGDELIVKKDEDGISADASNAKYQDISIDSIGAKGSGKSISKMKHKVLIDDATYTLCPVNNNDWIVRSESLDLNLKKNRGYAKNSRIEFFGIPIFYLPRYSFVLKGRGSGFLSPSYQTFNDSSLNKGSYQLKIPYYLNLAPDRDLLLAASYIKYRGFMYEGKYRQLLGRIIKDDEIQDSIFKFDIRYLSNDSSSHLSNSSASNIDRWLIDTSLEYDFNDKTHLSSRFHRVSDEKYNKEISHVDPTSLLSHFKLSYFNNENLLGGHILREHSQILDGCTDSKTCREKYLRAMELSISKGFSLEEKRQKITLGLQSTKFTNKTQSKVSGTRTHGNIDFERTHRYIPADSIYEEIPTVSTRANLSSTFYNLDNGKSITRNLGGLGLDVAIPIKNKGTFFGANTSNLILPKVSYNYRGRKAQGHIPKFDTTDNHEDIMTFSKITENVDYEVRKSYSDIVASIELALGNFSFNNTVSIEPEKLDIVGRSNTASLVINPRKFISIGYKNNLNSGKRSINFYGSYPITKSIHIFGGRDKITSTNTTNTETSGIVYESCCWAIRVAHIKKAAEYDYDYSTSAELILKGLGSTASSIDDKIETNIPGYSAELF